LTYVYVDMKQVFPVGIF